MPSTSQIQVIFKSKSPKYVIPETPILIPVEFARYGLSEIVNHLLNLNSPVPFDFLIDGKLLIKSISNYLELHSLSTENVLEIEYMESTLPPKESAQWPHEDWISSIKMIQEEELYILSGCMDGIARVYNASGQVLKTLSGHPGPIKCVEWMNKDVCATAGQDQVILAHSLQNDSVLYQCVGHLESIESMSVSLEESLIASGSADGQIKVWKQDDSDLEPAFENQEMQQQHGNRHKKKRLNESTPKMKSPLINLDDGHVGTVSSLFLNGNTLYSGGYDHSIRLWDLISQSNMQSMNSECVVTSLDVAHNHIVSGHTDNVVRIWDTNSATKPSLLLKSAHGHLNWITQVKWHPTDSFKFCSSSRDGTVRIWDVRSLSSLYCMTPKDIDEAKNQDKRALLTVDWTGNHLATGGESGILSIYTTC